VQHEDVIGLAAGPSLNLNIAIDERAAPSKVAMLATVLAVLLCSLLTGCGSGIASVEETQQPPGAVSFQGKVVNGARPIVGATVEMYAAGSTGYGSVATPLLTVPIMTDSNGAFTVSTSAYTCPSASTQVYLLAHGGVVDSSGTSNNALALMTAWGSCGDLESSTTITINEVTTVAAVWSLAPFMVSMQQVGSSSTNEAGLANAFLNAGLLADVSTGASPSALLPANLQVESAKLYSLANVLASCVSSTGVTACNSLFAAVAGANETLPTNTIDAALRVVKNPGRNVSSLYQWGNATYAGLASAPSDWTMTVAATGGGMNNPTSVGIDSTGRAWVVNEPGIVSAFSVQGVPLFAAGLMADGTANDFGLTIDPADNVWVTNGEAGSISKFTKDGTRVSPAGGFSGGGVSYPIALASDAAGNIWVVDNGNSSVAKFSNDGTELSPSNGYTGGGAFFFPVTVAIDANNTPWIASQDGNATHLSSTGTLINTVTCCAYPNGIAIDATGDAWVADHHADAVARIAGTSGMVLSITTKTGGLNDPYSLAADGAGNIWVVNNTDAGTLTEIGGSASASVGTALSPSFGYGLDAAMQSPYGIAIDASGNLWVSSFIDSRLVRFLGLAAPVKTPLTSVPQLP
jgi:streptogramin lyase